VANKNEALVSQKKGDRLSVLGRLVDVVEGSLDPLARGGQMKVATDDEGNAVSRELLALREATLAAEGVLFLCFLRPSLVRGFQADAERVLAAAAALSRAAASAHPSVAGTVRHQANLLLVSLLCLLSPPLSADPSAAAAESAAKADVGRFAAALAPAAQRLPAGSEPGFAAVLTLALAAVGPATGTPPAGGATLHAARVGGALGYLRDKLLRSLGFQDDALPHQEIVVSVLHSLLVAVVDFKPGEELLRGMVGDLGQGGAGAAPGTALAAGGMDVDAGPGAGGDSLVTLLGLLREMLSVTVERPPTEHLDTYMPVIKAAENKSSEHPAVMVAYLGMLRGLASSAAGAKWVQEWLVTSNSDVTWDRMFHYLHTYCDILQSEAPDGAVGPINLHRPDSVMPEEDAEGLAAFADVLAAVVAHGGDAAVEPLREVLSRLSRLDRPWRHALFDLMCHRVPSRLKAALMRALAAVVAHPSGTPLADPAETLAALHDSEILGGDLRSGGVYYDLRYQLEEIESRAEGYDGTLAFVRLVNALVAAAPPGPECLRYTTFVMDVVLGRLNQRTYRDVGQKWELAEACLAHMALCLRDPGAWVFSPSANPCGSAVMADVLGRGPAMGTLLQVVGVGTSRLAFMREASSEGVALERALHAALDLLSATFECDAGFLSPAREPAPSGVVGPRGPFFQSLDRVLIQEMRRLPRLLECIGYVYEPAIQTAALRVVLPLAEREPNLVPLLVQAGHHLPRIIKGFARCLEDAMEAAGAGGAADPRAMLVLRVLNAAARAPATPNLAHLLLGYSVDMGVDVGLANPLTEFSALQVLLRGSVRAARDDVELSEQMLELLCTMVVSPATRDVTLDALRQEPYAMLLPLLDDVAAATPDDPALLPHQRVAVVRRKAWLLQVFLTEIFYTRNGEALAPPRAGAEPSGAAPPSCTPRVLGRLFGAGAGGDAGASAQPLALRMLAQAAGAPPAPEPALPQVSPELLPALGLVRERKFVDAGGVWHAGAGGSPKLDEAALKEQLRSACPGISEASWDWQAAVEYGRQAAWGEEEHVCWGQVLGAWKQLVQVASTLCFPLLQEAAGGDDAQLTVFRLALGALDALPGLLQGGGARRGERSAGGGEVAQAVAEALAVLVSRLRELQAGDAAAGLPSEDLPSLDESQVRVLLRKLLALHPPASPEVRRPLCVAMLQALHYCRPPEGGGGAGDGKGRVSGEQLGRVVAAEIAASSDAVVDLVRESVGSPDARLRATALHLAGAVVASDPSGVVREELFRHDVPRALLRSLADEHPGRGGMAGVGLTGLATDGDSRGALWVVEAQLSLLLVLAAGPGGHEDGGGRRGHARQLFEQAALRHLANSRVCDVRPEPLPAPGAAADGPGGRGTVRERIHRAAVLMLRLVVSIVAALPESQDVSSDARRFLEAHTATLVRILEDAGDTRGGGSCETGRAELEQADLVLELACLLAPLDPVSPIHAALAALAGQFLCASADSPNRFVQAVRHASGAAAGPPLVAADAMHRLVLRVRASLSRYLLALSRAGTLHLPPVASPVQAPALRTDLVRLGSVLAETTQDLAEMAARRDRVARAVAEGVPDPRAMLDAATVEVPAGALSGRAPRALVEAAARGAGARMVRDAERSVAAMVGTVEALLEVVLGQLRRAMSAPGADDAGVGILRRAVPDVLKTLAPTRGLGREGGWSLAGHAVPHDCSAVADLVRQLRELLRHGV